MCCNLVFLEVAEENRRHGILIDTEGRRGASVEWKRKLIQAISWLEKEKRNFENAVPKIDENKENQVLDNDTLKEVEVLLEESKKGENELGEVNGNEVNKTRSRRNYGVWVYWYFIFRSGIITRSNDIL